MPSLKDLFRDFGTWTSAHGIPRIAGANGKCLRIFWSLMVLASVGLFMWQFFNLMHKFFAFDVRVITEIKSSAIAFPAVTVCSLNPYKNSAVNENPDMLNFLKLYCAGIVMQNNEGNEFNSMSTNTKLATYHALISRNASNDTDYDLINATNTNLFEDLLEEVDFVKIQNRVRELLMLHFNSKNHRLFGESYRFAETNHNGSSGWENAADEWINLPNLTYSVDDFILQCDFNQRPCNFTRDLQLRLHPVYGSCFTFNGLDPPVHTFFRAGPFALSLLLQMDQDEYLEVTESVGARVAIHPQRDSAFPDAFGYNAATGFQTSFAVQLTQTKRSPYPWGSCTVRGVEASHAPANATYSVEGCYRTCYQKHIVDYCGCADPRFDSGETETTAICTELDAPCLDAFLSGSQSSNEMSTEEFDALSSCYCPPPC